VDGTYGVERLADERDGHLERAVRVGADDGRHPLLWHLPAAHVLRVLGRDEQGAAGQDTVKQPRLVHVEDGGRGVARDEAREGCERGQEHWVTLVDLPFLPM